MEEESKEFQVTAKLVDAVNKLANQVAVLNQTLSAGIVVRPTDQPEPHHEQSKERG
jgi:hypothetical protein